MTPLVLNNPVTLLFPHVVEPEDRSKFGDTKVVYSTGFMFPKDNQATLNSIKEALLTEAKSFWPNRDVAADVKEGRIRLPWRTGEKFIEKRKAKLAKANKSYNGSYDYMLGHIVVRATSSFQPRLCIWEKGKPTPTELTDAVRIKTSQAQFYSGVKALLGLKFSAYESELEHIGDGIKAYLDVVVSLGFGKRLGGSIDPTTAFAGYKGPVGDATGDAVEDVGDETEF